MTRLFWYPALAVTALACCAPVFEHGAAGIPAATRNAIAAIAAVIHLP